MAQYPQINRISTARLLGSMLTLCVSMGAVIAPMVLVLARGFVWPEASTLAYFGAVIRATLWQATLSTVVVICMAVPLAWAIVRAPGVRASLLAVLVGVPFVMPTPVVATMFAALCARDTWCATVLRLEVPQGLALVVIVHAWYNTGVLVRLLVEAWQAIQGRYTAAAATLGASEWRRLVSIEWPLLRPAFVAGTTLVFLYCVGSFGVVLLLGGGRIPSLEVETWRQTSQLLRLDIAACLALMQLLLSIVLITLSNRFAPHVVVDSVALPWRGAHTWMIRIAHGVIVVGIVMVVTPFVMTIWRLCAVPNWDSVWQLMAQPVRGSGLFMSPWDAVGRSLGIAVAVACIVMVLGWLNSDAPHGMQLLVMLPLGMSAVSLGFGYILWFGRWGVLTAWWVVVVAHVVLALPLVTRQLVVARQRLAERYRWAAATLGATPWRQVYSIEFPLLRRALLAAALFGFSVSFGDFAASLLLTRPDAVTAPVYVARLLGRPGAQNFNLAQVLAVIMAMVCMVVMVVAEYLRRRARHNDTTAY